MLTEFGPEIWITDGARIPQTLGFRYPTRMVVIRLADGGMWLHSPVTPTPALLEAVTALGPVAHLVAPNLLHHLDIGDWQAAFPDAMLHALPGLRAKRPDLRIDADLSVPAWPGQIDQITLRNRITDEAVFFHRASGTAIFTDLLQQFPPGWFTGWRGVIARLDAMTGPAPQVPRKFRLGFAGQRPQARAAVAQILRWPTQRVLMAHGAPVADAGEATLRHAFRWLIR